MSVFAYELLYRASKSDQFSGVIDDDSATRQLIMNTFTAIGLERLVGRSPALINVGREFLLREAAERYLPTEGVILEVLETVMPDAEVLAALAKLRKAGMCICLDDFQLTAETRPLLNHADIVKIEVNRRTVQEISRIVEQVRGYGARLLAEKVEDQQQVRDCLDLGFDYFQGYFLNRPRTVRGAIISSNRLVTLRFLAAIQKSDLEVVELERIISSDVGLSYRLLRYLNSAYYSLRRPPDSIRQAILYLGVHELRRWAALTALATLDDKPSELISTLMVRARMCELIGRQLYAHNGDTCFTVGLFSGLDALLDVPLADALAELPLGDEIHEALLHFHGPAGQVLEYVLRYETGDWSWLEAQEHAQDMVLQAYLHSIDWTRTLLEQ